MPSTTMDEQVHCDTIKKTECTDTNGNTSTTKSTSAIPTTATSTTCESESESESVKESASNSQDSTTTPPHHVLFVVHGMGRQLEEYGNYEPNVALLVENTKTVLQSTFHDLQTDVHIIPTEWHSKLHNLVDDRMSLASLRTVPKVRMVMNDYLADILYYFNPHYGSKIVGFIVEELNEAYDTFMEQHPDFNGKISIFALSLGGVAMFDILTCIDDEEEHTEMPQNSPESTLDNENIQNTTEHLSTPNSKSETVTENNPDPNKKPKFRKQDQEKFRARIPKLKFRPNYLFTVGSPVGAVMVMRNLDWDSFHPPDDIIHHNLFHPFDPLGYRIEPLIDPVFAGVPAATLASYNTSQGLFSLPSLPSLFPIASFWETKLPTLPRPSIPTLSTLSQMTQSIKAGRWLSSATSINEDSNRQEEEDGTSTPTSAQGENDMDDSDRETAVSQATSVSENNNSGVFESSTTITASERLELDADASATEYMAALTVSTCLSQTGPSSSDVTSENAAQIDTTTGSLHNDKAASRRRPSLGPRRVSSRVEESPKSPNPSDSRNSLESMGMGASSGNRLDRVKEEVLSALPSPSPMEIEHYLSMEDGPTDEEKAQCIGAKSHVIQEPMVRSRTSSYLGHEEEQSESVKSETSKQVNPTDKKKEKKMLLVEGRPTKVPYRIDHVLQETTVDQYTNEYLLGMRSHFRYWGNRDLAFHILNTILRDKDPSSEDEIIDLKLSLPPPVSVPKGAKEAAEVKAKLAATSARSRSDTASSRESKTQNRKSFSLSFFSALDLSLSGDTDREHQLEQERLRKQEEIDEELALMDEERELFGHRYSNQTIDEKQADSKPKLSHGSSFYNEPATHAAVSNDDKSSASLGWVPAPASATVSIPELTRPAKLHHRS